MVATTKPLYVTLDLPPSVSLSPDEARQLLVVKLIDAGRLSQSEAAKVLGISRHELLELMAQHQVPVVRYTSEEWERESKVLATRQRRRRQGR